MIKFILSLLIGIFIPMQIFAGDSWTVKVCVIIPQILELTEQPKTDNTEGEEIDIYEETVMVQGKKEEQKDNIIVTEETTRNGEIVLVKTIVAK